MIKQYGNVEVPAMEIFVKPCFLLQQLGLTVFQQTLSLDLYQKYQNIVDRIVQSLYGDESEAQLNILALEVQKQSLALIMSF